VNGGCGGTPYDHEMDYSGLFVIGVLRKPFAGHQVSPQLGVNMLWIAELEPQF
jgi:hypothetical protein